MAFLRIEQEVIISFNAAEDTAELHGRPRVYQKDGQAGRRKSRTVQRKSTLNVSRESVRKEIFLSETLCFHTHERHCQKCKRGAEGKS